jgi:hypothetical protein
MKKRGQAREGKWKDEVLISARYLPVLQEEYITDSIIFSQRKVKDKQSN